MRVMTTLPILLALSAAASLATTRSEVEEEIARISAQREELRSERARLVESAVALARRISPATGTRATARAGPELSRELSELDRLSERLDAVEARIASATRALGPLLLSFDLAADAEERALETRARREGAEAVVPGLTALSDARDRVSPLRQSGTFRPPLDVRFDAQEGPRDIEDRIVIIDAERERIARRIIELEGEEVLLATRLAAKRQWARDLGSARRETGGGMELLDQVHERTERTLRTLVARSDELLRERAGLLAADARLEATRHEAIERLRALAPRQVAP